MKAIWSVLMVVFLSTLFSSQAFAGKATRRLMNHSRGIASVSTKFKFRVSKKQWAQMTPTQKVEYLTIVRDLALSLGNVSNNGFAQLLMPGTMDPLNQLLFPTADAAYNLGIQCPGDDYNCDTAKSFQDASQIVSCSGGQKPCATYFGLTASGKALCASGNSTANCPTTDASIQVLKTKMDECNASTVKSAYCSSLLANYNQHVKGQEDFCSASARASKSYCKFAQSAITKLDPSKTAPPEITGDRGTNPNAQSCERAVSELKSRGRMKYNKEYLKASKKPEIEAQLRKLDEEIVSERNRLKTAPPPARESISKNIAKLEADRLKLFRTLDTILKREAARPRAQKVNEKWARILYTVRNVCPNHSAGAGVTMSDVEKTFGNCRLPDKDFPMGALDEANLIKLREQGGGITNETDIGKVMTSIGITPAQFDTIFCQTPNVRKTGKKSEFSRRFSANHKYRETIEKGKKLGIEKEVQASLGQMWKCVKDANAELRNGEWIPEKDRDLQAHASKDQCEPSAIYKPLSELKGANGSTPFLLLDKASGKCHIISGKPEAVKPKGVKDPTWDDDAKTVETKYKIKTQVWNSITNKFVDSDPVLEYTRSEIESMAKERRFRSYSCHFSELPKGDAVTPGGVDTVF
ncbi:MAG: hypothetical protein KDD33_01175 [Bdellovibrionales bacterium]|nr:hypothetical protein [Bdellovibrionales bacterium]